MRNILISAALVSAAALSVPAAAQFQDFGRGGYGYGQGAVQSIQSQVRQLHQRIDRMYQRRLISNREMRSLHERADNT